MKKKLIIIIFILLIINLLWLIYLINYNKDNVNNTDDEIISIPGEEYSFELNEKIFPEDYIEFEDLTSNYELDKKEIYKALYKLVKFIPTLYSDVSENNVSTYYNNNETYINTELKISNENEFVNLYKLAKNVYGKDVYYRTVKFLNDTYVKDSNASCNITIIYNNDKEITIKLVIDDDNNFKFTPITEK